jgi:flavin reductase (DIM6/NTAB) family NADH-FMN oxidoreductase RutF
MPVDASAFREAMAEFASGITVVTTRDASGQPLGITVSSFCSVSLDPPLVLLCIENRSETHAGFRSARCFAVSVLEEAQERWSRRFATPGPEKFADEAMPSGNLGLALVPGALAHVECRIVAEHPAGDHVVYVAEVEHVSVRPGRPLVYHARGYRRLRGEGA